MKVNNCTKRKDTTKLHTWEAYYDPYSGEYEELYGREIDIEELTEEEVRAVTLGHDITITIVPDFFVVVYARNVKKLKRYKEMMDTNYIRWLLDKKYQEEEYVMDCYWEAYDFHM